MKTTIDIADSLLNEARRVAATEGTTLRALVEQGLRDVLRTRKTARRFRLRNESFRGDGLNPEFENASWDAIRDEIYRGRGS